MEKKIIGWAVVDDDGDIPDLTHPNIGAFYHINSKKGSADTFIKTMEKNGAPKGFYKVVKCEIIYSPNL